MEKKKKPDPIDANDPIKSLDHTARDKNLKDDLDMEVNTDNLLFNEEENSYEIDREPDDPDYRHPDPYDTAAENGADFDSDYDEANPTVGDEYDKELDLESDLGELGMHVDKGQIVELNPIDEELSQTPEDDRDDLDEEGYPRNDEK